VKGLVDSSLRRLGEEVTRYGGTVDKYIGDNVMAIFGAPVAHEDDESRAVRAALGMQGAMEGINRELGARHGASFQLRVGINTGEVLAGAIGDGYTVIGDTVNVAARLQAAGRPGTVTVGERTHRATAGEVEYRTLEPLHLKGKAEPVPAWEAVGLLAAQPARRTRTRSATPLVGRDDELGLMESLYGRVTREGRPHLVTLVGQAGVGKSRLLHEFRQRVEVLAGDTPAIREGRCLPYGSGVVYWALSEVIRADAGILDEDTADQAWEKVKDYACDLLLEDEEERESIDRRGVLGHVDAEQPRHQRRAPLDGLALALVVEQQAARVVLDLLPRRSSARTRRSCARPSSPPSARRWRRGRASSRSCSRSRTSTGPTTACST
jgi:hypothetical protein